MRRFARLLVPMMAVSFLAAVPLKAQPAPRKPLPCGAKMTKAECAEVNSVTVCRGERIGSATTVAIKCTIENSSTSAFKAIRLECVQFDAAGRLVAKEAIRTVPAGVRAGETKALAPFTVERVSARTANVRCNVDGIEVLM